MNRLFIAFTEKYPDTIATYFSDIFKKDFPNLRFGKPNTLSNIGLSEYQESVANSTAHCSEERNNMEQQQSELLTADDTSSTIPYIII
nr:unnamed protein product [Callosobruchus analis]